MRYVWTAGLQGESGAPRASGANHVFGLLTLPKPLASDVIRGSGLNQKGRLSRLDRFASRHDEQSVINHLRLRIPEGPQFVGSPRNFCSIHPSVAGGPPVILRTVITWSNPLLSTPLRWNFETPR